LEVNMLAALLAVPLMIGSSVPVPDHAALHQAFVNGEFGVTEYVSLLVQAVESPSSLPSEFMHAHDGRGICLTPFIIDAMNAAQDNPEAMELLDGLRFRPPKQASFVSPEGFFTIHYDTTGSHAVYQSDVDFDPADGVPDYVNRCAEVFDHVWYEEVDALGYDQPGSDNGLGGSNNYDVYMHDNGPGVYGVTWQEGPASEYPDRRAFFSHIHVHPSFNGFGYIDRLVPLKITAAHEFQHACQMSYDAGEPLPWWEQTAMWMEDVVYDHINDYYTWVDPFFEAPHEWLYSSGAPFWYAACIWPHFLEHIYGRDIMRQIWVECIPTNVGQIEAVDSALHDVGSSRDEAITEFRIWNYFTGDRDDENHYEEGAFWPESRIMAHHITFPVLDGVPSAGEIPDGLACNYIRFHDLDALDSLRVSFTDQSVSLRDWSVEFTVPQGDIQQYATMTLENGEGTIVINLQGATSVVMIPVNRDLSQGEYSYWARDASELVTLDEYQAVEIQGDGDGRLEAGEEMTLGATFTSIAADLQTTALLVRSLDPSIMVTDSIALGGSLVPGESIEFEPGEIALDIAAVLEPHQASLQLLIGPEGGTPVNSFVIDVVLGLPPHLVFDDDGGADHETYITATLDSLGLIHDVWDDEAGLFPAFPLDELQIQSYQTVVWFTGDAGNCLDDTDMDRLEELLDAGVHLLLSGQDVAESLAATEQGANLMDAWLGVQYDGYENSLRVEGPDDDPLFDGMSFATAGYGLDGANNQTSRDRLLPNPDVDVCLEYQTGYPAAVRRDFGASRLIFCGFGVEAIVDDNESFSTRREFFTIALDYLENGIASVNDLPVPKLFAIRSVWPNPAANTLRAQLLIPASSLGLKASLIDVAGRVVASLPHDSQLTPGEALVSFRVPEAVPSGLYFLNVQHDAIQQSVPVTILK
jgi:hypothetical protein